MKKLALLLALIMLATTVLIPAWAEEPADAGDSGGESAGGSEGGSGGEPQDNSEELFLKTPCNFALIEADEATGQVRLTYDPEVTNILEEDGLKFKDLNKNGQLDVYEDWRKTTEERAWDMINNQLTPEEEAGLHFCSQPDYKARETIASYKNNCLLFNLNGDPETIINVLNHVQAAAEAERLGIPMTYASDREFNAFGGYIDKAHDAFGSANDPELAYQLAYIYGQSMVAVGLHVTFEPFANEIGAQYGENPEHIASIVYQEIKGLEDSGFASCTKHWVGRGGDSSFANARSVAQNMDNWMVGWKAAFAAGAEWVMTNCAGQGFTNTTDPKWDSYTMGYLRNELGFDGVVVTDWWPLNATQTDPMPTLEGVMLNEQSIEWLYTRAIQLGTDIFGTGIMSHETDSEAIFSAGGMYGNYPDILTNAYTSGLIEEMGALDAYHYSTFRILRFKFDKGLFENPYRVTEESLAIIASPEYAAEPWPITTNEDLRAARNPKEVELAERLQAESAVLMKNEGGLLPLAKGTKIYIESSSNDTLDHYKQYLADYGEIVDDMEEADVVIGYFGQLNDASELLIEDTLDEGKPLVLTLTSKPDEFALTSATALLYMPFSQQPDHGSGEAGFIYGTEPWVYAKILFGEFEPAGITQKEQARNETEDALQWKDLAGDQGASPYVRLIVQALMMADTEYHASPNNYGDPLVIYNYGMRYGQFGDFAYSCLILPQSIAQEETVNSNGSATVSNVVKNTAKAGEPFTVYCLLNNNGADDLTMVQAKVDGEVVAEKLYTVQGGSWRVVQMELTLEAGEHEVAIGDAVGTLTVAE
ncbi:MAG: glycoside hydrolase family 3 protein [Clostridia bacterium]|nr:glycoside hydrolase family 3 protein [Clostridia bacterium]